MADLDNDSGGGAREQQREQDRFLPINVMTPKRRCRSAYRSSSASSPDKPPTSARERRGRPSTATICCGPWPRRGFEEYVVPPKVYLHKFREMESEKMTSSTSTGAAGTVTGTGMSAGHGRHSDEYHHDHQREKLHVHGHGACCSR